MSMNSNDLKIGLIGATGAVGRVALDILGLRGHPPEKIVVTASERSVGRRIEYGNTQLTLAPTDMEALADVDVAFISASAEVSREIAPLLSDNGTLVIDDSSEFRMRDGVPLVVPEVNGADVCEHSGIVSIPNCSVTPLVMILEPLRALARLESVIVSTYQSVSGAGAGAVRQLFEEVRQRTEYEDTGDSRSDPRQYGFNAVPRIDDYSDGGYTREEQKTLNETRKILHEPNLRLSSTCVRVPVEIGHSMAVNVQFTKDVELNAVRQALAQFEGVDLVDDPDNDLYPTPLMSAGKDAVLVGRIRVDTARPRGVVMWLASDNLRKGAALNALQIMDEAIKRGCLKGKGN